MSRGISITPYLPQKPFVRASGGSYRLRVVASDPVGMPAEIFAYQLRTINAAAAKTGDEFCFVCSPIDLDIYPLDEPSITMEHQFYRKSVVDVIVPNEEAAEQALSDILEEVAVLIAAMNLQETQVPETTVQVGGDDEPEPEPDPVDDDDDDETETSTSSSDQEEEPEPLPTELEELTAYYEGLIEMNCTTPITGPIVPQSGSTNMTAYVQGRINAEIAAATPTRPGVLRFAPGVYPLGSLTIRPTPSHPLCCIYGEDATLRLIPNQSTWARIFTVGWNSNQDSIPLLIHSLLFDMNRGNQAWDGSYNLEHQAALFLEGRLATASGRLNTIIVGVDVQDSAADAIYCHHQVNAQIFNCNSSDIFRCALGITGNRTSILARYCHMLRGGIDCEPNSANDVITVVLDNIYCNKMNAGMEGAGSSIIATNMTMDIPNATNHYVYCPPGCTYRLSDSEVIGYTKIRLPGTLTEFNNVHFRGRPGIGQLIGTAWSHNSRKANQTVRIQNCEFDGPAVYGVHAGADDPANNNNFYLIDSHIRDTTYGLVFSRKGHPHVSGSTFNGVAIPDIA